jgi:hypothetical protein
MTYLILLIVPDRDDLDDLLLTWHSAGLRQINSVQSSEFSPEIKDQPLQEDFPLIPSLKSISDLSHSPSKIVIAFSESIEMINSVFQTTKAFLHSAGIESSSSLSVLQLPDILTPESGNLI